MNRKNKPGESAHGNLLEISPDMWRGTIESAGWVKHLPALPVIVDRQSFLASTCQDKTILHIGFGDAGAKDITQSEGRWVHDAIVKNASRVIGLDIDESSVRQAREEGLEAHRVDCTDSEAMTALGLPHVDLILLGETIEHVGNPGGLLRAIRALSAPSTDLIITTPNAYRITTIINVATRRETTHPDHVAIWSLPLLAQLVERNGWRPTAAAMYQVPALRDSLAKRSPGVRSKAGELVRWAADRLVRTATPYWADGLIIQAAPAPVTND